MCALALCASYANHAVAQVPGITVSPGTPISTDAPRTPHFETFFAVSRPDPGRFLATAMTVRNGRTESAVYLSRDGGRSWRVVSAAPGDTITLTGGDPVVYFDGQGAAFFGTYNGIGFTLMRSADGGEHWEGPIIVGHGLWDRPWLTFDTTSGPFAGRVYATAGVGGTIAVRTSLDRGRTFSQEIALRLRFPNGTAWQGQPVVTPDGKLVIPVVMPAEGDSAGMRHGGVLVSEDGGESFDRYLAGSAVRFGPSIAPDSGGHYLQALSALAAAVDHSSGPHRGRVYLLWTEFLNGRWTKRVASTDDLGLNWSGPVTVNNNAEGHDPGNGGIAANRDGVVGVVWNDRRDDPKNQCFRLYFAASIDGGETFLPNVKASDTPVCPNHPANAAAIASSFVNDARERAIVMNSVSSRWPNGGDTFGLLAGPDGIFHVAWISSVNDVMQLFYCQIRVDRATIERVQLSSPRAERELTNALQLQLDSAIFDTKNRVISVGVRLSNPGLAAYQGPFTLRLARLGKGFPGVRAVNADNGEEGAGAAWEYRGSDTGKLKPGERSERKILRWTYTGAEDPRRAFVAAFRIFGKSL